MKELEQQIPKQELVQKQAEVTNYEKRKQISDRVIQQLKGEMNELKWKKSQIIKLNHGYHS